MGDATKDAGSQPVAIFSMFGDLGAIIGPLVAGLLADQFSYGRPSRVGAALIIAAGAWSWFDAARPRRTTATREAR